MRQKEFDIKQMFTQDNELPQIVRKKVQETYDSIRVQEIATSTGRQVKRFEKSSLSRRWYLPKAAAILIAGFLVTGVTAVAAVVLLHC